MQFMNSFLLAGPKCSFEANETLYSCSPGRGKASGERGNLGKKRKKTSSTRMPFDQRNSYSPNEKTHNLPFYGSFTITYFLDKGFKL